MRQHGQREREREKSAQENGSCSLYSSLTRCFSTAVKLVIHEVRRKTTFLVNSIRACCSSVRRRAFAARPSANTPTPRSMGLSSMGLLLRLNYGRLLRSSTMPTIVIRVSSVVLSAGGSRHLSSSSSTITTKCTPRCHRARRIHAPSR